MQCLKRIQLGGSNAERLLELILARLAVLDRCAGQPIFAALFRSERHRDELQIHIEAELRDGELNLARHRLRHAPAAGSKSDR